MRTGGRTSKTSFGFVLKFVEALEVIEVDTAAAKADGVVSVLQLFAHEGADLGGHHQSPPA